MLLAVEFSRLEPTWDNIVEYSRLEPAWDNISSFKYSNIYINNIEVKLRCFLKFLKEEKQKQYNIGTVK